MAEIHLKKALHLEDEVKIVSMNVCILFFNQEGKSAVDHLHI